MNAKELSTCFALLLGTAGLFSINTADRQSAATPQARGTSVGGAQAIVLGPGFRDPRTPIGSLPFTITDPGSYYLTGNLTGSSGNAGIIVQASDATIDLNGFALEGVAGSDEGIVAAGSAERVAVLNGMVHGWGREGIDLVGAEDSRLESLTVSDCGSGGAFAGIVTGPAAVLQDVITSDNTAEGFEFGSSSGVQGHVTASNCHANGNAGVGFLRIASGGSADSATFENCLAQDNGSQGFELGQASCRGCSSYQNAGNGFNAVGSTLADCVSTSNGGDGFFLFSSIVSDSTAETNVGNGFLLQRQCYLSDSKATLNGGDGAFILNTRNVIDSCFFALNTGFGVASGNINNTVTRNNAIDNVAGTYNVPGSRVGPIQTPATATSPWANF